MKSFITMRYPSSWYGEMRREGAPCVRTVSLRWQDGCAEAVISLGTDDAVLRVKESSQSESLLKQIE